jgi:hypothetical protein
MELEVFDGWTIDRRLKQLRKIDENDKILFVDFDSELGQAIFELKLISHNYFQTKEDLYYAKKNNVDELKTLALEYEHDKLSNEFAETERVIKKLERELK